jgi:hypothetical protein
MRVEPVDSEASSVIAGCDSEAHGKLPVARKVLNHMRIDSVLGIKLDPRYLTKK